ncbi:hypothetical protein [Bathymodiolus japonicus methanotrophic gill symbiont]|uniref:hypothetical protein n=1 Tax=Bathymodiolus japonicus methanotrophic gill symbiont TaxID=113269 RepID=UPI001C8E75D9|nr:hypothetical protein [Bathymodiolus japonicus methanotrophic gill symbiont]
MQYYPPEMQSDLLAAYLAKGKDYQARTANFLNEVWQHQQPLVLQRADEVARAVASTQQNKQQSHALDTTLLKFPNNYLW